MCPRPVPAPCINIDVLSPNVMPLNCQPLADLMANTDSDAACASLAAACRKYSRDVSLCPGMTRSCHSEAGGSTRGLSAIGPNISAVLGERSSSSFPTDCARKIAPRGSTRFGFSSAPHATQPRGDVNGLPRCIRRKVGSWSLWPSADLKAIKNRGGNKARARGVHVPVALAFLLMCKETLRHD